MRPVRERRSPPGFILPCQPVLAHRVPTGPEWIHELKWDSYRIMPRKQGDLVRLWSRNGRNWAEAFPRIVEAIRALPTESVVIDGEAVCLRSDGQPDFHVLRSKLACREARLIAFDLLVLEGADLRARSLQERRMELAMLLNDEQQNGLWFSSHVEGSEGEALYRHACRSNLEGIVSKRVKSLYRSGSWGIGGDYVPP